MKKIIISIVSSFFILFIFWMIQGYTEYGEDLQDYTIDMKRTLEVFDREYFVEDTLGWISKLHNLFTDDMKDIPILNKSNMLSSLVSAGYYILSFVMLSLPFSLSLLADAFFLLSTIIDFIFVPKFIRIR